MNYWQQRFIQMENAQNDKSIKKVYEIQEQFGKAQAAVEEKLNAWYQRFARNNGVSMAEAKRMLSAKELKEFKWSVEEYIKYGQANELGGKWRKELENASARIHISRLEALKIHIQHEIEKLYGNCTDSIDRHIKNTYLADYYHTAFEIQKGTGIGYRFEGIDSRLINNIIVKPWAVDGRNFSERLWGNKTKLINTLYNSLTRMFITGEGADRAISEVAKEMNASRRQASTIVMTESAAFANEARRDCMNKLGVEQFEVVETLDSRTCDICGNMDGRHYNMSDFQIGVTAPPFHPNCRGCTVPYFGDEYDFIGKRAARGEDGKTYFVPADITYQEWYDAYVKNSCKTDLTENPTGSKMKSKGETMSLEYQRYGRNKETLVNSTYINSGEYRNKFDNITDKREVNRVLYSKAKEMLQHRSGTMLEDMYWINKDTGKVIASALNEKIEGKIVYSNSLKKTLSGKQGLIAMHTHPQSMPPSVDDFNSAFRQKYALNFVLCHDGKIFGYSSNQEVSKKLYTMYIGKYLDEGFKEYEAQIKTLEKLKETYDIDFWEVK